MNEAQFEAVQRAAGEGISFDGLSVAVGDGGYILETPDERHDQLSEDAFREHAEKASSFVTNWYYWRQGLDDVGNARYAYLRWLEHAEEWVVTERYERLADGITRTWGQLAVTTRIDDDGSRTYELRHDADRGTNRETLDRYTEPLDARQLAKFDGAGGYRPLKTAPTLPTGWTFVDLDGQDLLQAVEFFYPATVANWQLERQGDLDVTHWQAVAERQTGIYGAVEELPPEAVERAAHACCVDSQCLKRREWELDASTELDVPRGDGEFPCREACSLFVAAAREFAMNEREQTRTYEFELTPSERDQLEAIVDAVADGRADDVRDGEVDDGANRYRARYLRAKLFDTESGGSTQEQNRAGRSE
jgi:hypothetical protein